MFPLSMEQTIGVYEMHGNFVSVPAEQIEQICLAPISAPPEEVYKSILRAAPRGTSFFQYVHDFNPQGWDKLHHVFEKLRMWPQQITNHARYFSADPAYWEGESVETLVYDLEGIFVDIDPTTLICVGVVAETFA